MSHRMSKQSGDKIWEKLFSALESIFHPKGTMRMEANLQEMERTHYRLPKTHTRLKRRHVRLKKRHVRQCELEKRHARLKKKTKRGWNKDRTPEVEKKTPEVEKKTWGFKKAGPIKYDANMMFRKNVPKLCSIRFQASSSKQVQAPPILAGRCACRKGWMTDLPASAR